MFRGQPATVFLNREFTRNFDHVIVNLLNMVSLLGDILDCNLSVIIEFQHHADKCTSTIIWYCIQFFCILYFHC